MSRDIEIKFKKKKSDKIKFNFSFFKKKNKFNENKFNISKNLKIKANLIDFSPFKFLNQTLENERLEIIKKIQTYQRVQNLKHRFQQEKKALALKWFMVQLKKSLKIKLKKQKNLLKLKK